LILGTWGATPMTLIDLVPVLMALALVFVPLLSDGPPSR
jgi:hypothetical protein